MPIFEGYLVVKISDNLISKGGKNQRRREEKKENQKEEISEERRPRYPKR
jgi:hypothetical protein